MSSRWQRALAAMELEERILNAGSVIAIVGTFLPWLSGEWLGGDKVTHTAFSFYSSFLGIAIFLLHVCILSVAVVPLVGGPHLLSRRYVHIARLLAALQASILVLAALSVLTKVTLDFNRVEVRYGIYVTLIGSLICALYAFLRLREQRRLESQDLFQHPEDQGMEPAEHKDSRLPPPPAPPPPPPLQPEEHYLHPRL